jgi:hypothetical protein
MIYKHAPSDTPGQRSLCGALTGELVDPAHAEDVNCGLCLGLLAHKRTTNPEPKKTAAEAIAEVAELVDKPPTDDTGADDTTPTPTEQMEAAARAVSARLDGAPMEPITSTVTRHDPAHHTERSLRASASWQVLCQARVELNALAGQTTFHGAYPVGEVTRLCQDLHKAMVKDAYAWGMHQRDMDWLVAGIDTTANYREHFAQTWGEQFARNIDAWWQELYDAAHARALEDHAERQRLSSFAAPAHG